MRGFADQPFEIENMKVRVGDMIMLCGEFGIISSIPDHQNGKLFYVCHPNDSDAIYFEKINRADASRVRTIYGAYADSPFVDTLEKLEQLIEELNMAYNNTLLAQMRKDVLYQLFIKTYPYFGHKDVNGSLMEIEAERYQQICACFGRYSPRAKDQLEILQRMRARAH